MAFPTTPILDNFNDVETNPMTGWSDVINGLMSGGSTCTGSNAVDQSISNYTAQSFTTSKPEVYVTLVTQNAGDFFQIFFLDGTTSGYLVGFDFTSYDMYRFDSGTPTLVKSGTVTQNNGDSFGLSHNGSIMTLYRKPSAGSWGVVDTFSDSTYGTLTYNIGLTAYGVIVALDNFGGGATTSAGGIMTTRTGYWGDI